MRKTLYALIAAIAAAGGLLLAAVPAGAASGTGPATGPVTISFDHVGTGDSAALQTGVYSAGAVLTVSNHVRPGANARIVLNGIPEDAPMPDTEPVFKATDFLGGNPRLVIETGQSAFYFDYPAGSSDCTAAGCWWGPGLASGDSYAHAFAKINSQDGVFEAFVVADNGDAGTFTTTVTNLTWAGQVLLPALVATRLTAQDTCGNYANRHWTVSNVAGAGRVAYVATRLNSGRWYYDGKHFVPAGGSSSFVTHRGGLLHVHYVAAPGVWGNGLFASHVSAC